MQGNKLIIDQLNQLLIGELTDRFHRLRTSTLARLATTQWRVGQPVMLIRAKTPTFAWVFGRLYLSA